MAPTTIPELFAQAVRERPRRDCFSHRDALQGGYVDLSSAEAAAQVEALALALADLGIARGDRVALLSENRVEWALTDLATLALGAVDVPIYSTLLSDAVGYILKDCGPKVVCVSTSAQADKIAAIRDQLPFLERVVAFDPVTLAGAIPFGELLERGRALARGGAKLPGPPVRAEDPASIIYTSGTTGQPKGVVLTHGNFVANVLTCGKLVPFYDQDRCLSFLPLSHVLERMAGLYLMLHDGVGIAYAESIDTVPQDLLDVRPTVVISVPRLYEKMYARILATALGGPRLRKWIFFWAKKTGERRGELLREKRPLPWHLRLRFRVADRLVFSKLRARTGGRLRLFVSGGAPLASEINAFFYAAGMLILEGYGLTETSPVIAVNLPERLRIGSVGPVLPDTEVRIAEDGEILVRGPQVMAGYYNHPEATREVLSPDGWLATGDIGHLDADGYLYITDRKKDIIVTAGGKNIPPQPIENEFRQNRFVGQVVVIGDRRPYLTCLIVPNFDNLQKYAAWKKLGRMGPAELIAHPQVVALFERRVARINRDLPGFNQVKRFRLLPHDFTLEAGEVTPTLKIRRQVVATRYRELIDAMYAEANGG